MLRFSGDGRRAPCNLSDADWKQLLDFCDRSHLTLSFAERCGECRPHWAKRRLKKCLAQNAVRWDRIKSAFEECASAFREADIPFVLLKGFSHCPDFITDPRARTQYDLDLLFTPEDVMRAYDAALRLGFEPLGGFERFPIDHLPTMVKKTGWEWTGDYFDTEIPVSLELHFRLWDERTERFAPAGLEQFWERRQSRELEGLRFTALHPADMTGYSCLHILRHLLRGGVRPSHVYELALLLDRRCDDDAFWKLWDEMHGPSLKRLEAIAFGLSRRWFNCRVSPRVANEIERLPVEIGRWLDVHGESPLVALFRPNKDDLWLHWNLLNSTGARLAILRRRMLPQQLPGAVRGVHISSGNISWKLKLTGGWAYLLMMLGRAKYHAMAVLPTALSAVRWWSAGWGYRP